MDKNIFENPNVSRRSFVRTMGLTTGALATGGIIKAASASGLKKDDSTQKKHQVARFEN